MSLKVVLVLLALVFCGWIVEAKLKGDDCEVCVQFLNNFKKRLEVNDVESKEDAIEVELMKACKEAKGKDERLCYYIGASEIAAYRLTKAVTKPLSFNKPVEKICEDLKKNDAQICELKYDKDIDFNTVDLKKLRVKELKKILNKWGEDCRGCVEKTEFIDKINTVKIKYIRAEL